ncbi:hypothetical protein ACFQY0_04305 [Haloferula chungangensis]|uniref:DUF3552 domain-containing protein n=1 Tax=Haloferula chungangensis TaxID=1048331 RepID=A0ABW2L5G4_9BACT
MANIFAILTAVLLAASAFLALKNKEAYTKEIDDRKIAETRLATTQTKLAGLQKRRNDTIAEKNETMQATVGLREEEEQQTAKNDAVKKDISAKREQSESQAAEIAEIKEKTAKAGELKELAGKIKRLQEDIVGLEDEKAAKESQRTNLLAQRESTQSTVTAYNEETRKISSKKSFGNARISSIFGPWGFVTLSAGNNGGIVSGSTLNVVRGGEPIAELRVRSVESNRASADVVPNSLAEDTTLMVGDKVVPAEPSAPAEAN